jgi:hypothetical protein
MKKNKEKAAAVAADKRASSLIGKLSFRTFRGI